MKGAGLDRSLAALAGLMMVSAACTASASDPGYEPVFRSTSCPPDAVVDVLIEHRCGYLTVPENRTDLNGPTIDLFVLVGVPPGGPISDDAMIFVGEDIGQRPFGGHLVIAARVRRVTYMMDQRGVGDSRPSLACPELDAVATDLLEVRMSDTRHTEIFLGAAAACHERLTREGIDLSAYNLAEMAADVEDLRRALGIDEVNLQARNTSSLIALEVMRRFPDHIRSVVLDGPVPPFDPFVEAIEGTRAALEDSDRACGEESACSAAYPDISGAFAAATSRLDASPIVTRVFAPRTRRPVDIVLDAGMLARIVRWHLYDDFRDPTPALIYDALDGVYAGGYMLVDAYPLCQGYERLCNDPGLRLSLGVRYSMLCHDVLPFVNRRAAVEAARGNVGFREAFVNHPYRGLCETWTDTGTDPTVREPVSSEIPTLVMYGTPNAAMPLDDFESAMGGLSAGYLVTFPGYSQAALGYDCPRSIRNAFVDRPTVRPDTGCVDATWETYFVSPEATADSGSEPAAGLEGVWETEVTFAGARSFGVYPLMSLHIAGRYQWTISDGRWRMRFEDPSRLPVLSGTYSVRGERVKFVISRPFAMAGSWSARWRTGGRSLITSDSSVEPQGRGILRGLFLFGYTRWSEVAKTWMEAEPWTRVG